MLVVIFGPHAVGKMTVGEELAKMTNLRLFHNHVSIELALQYHEYHTEEAKYLIKLLRDEIMTTVANSDQKGLIFTFIWALEMKEDWDYIDHVMNIFKEHDIYFVELYSDISVRQERNVTENRLNKKPSKRNVEWSQRDLLRSFDNHKMNTTDEDFSDKNYMKIDNTNLSAIETAQLILDNFELNK